MEFNPSELSPAVARRVLKIEVTHPYFERVQELFRKKDEQNARTTCEAIILALYRFKHHDHFSEIEEYKVPLITESLIKGCRTFL